MSDDNKVVPLRPINSAQDELRLGMINVCENLASGLRDGSFAPEDIGIAVFLNDHEDQCIRVSVGGFRDDTAASRYFANFIKQHGFSLPNEDEHEDV